MATLGSADCGISPQHFAWLVGSLCQLNRIPFDAALLLQRFPAPHSEQQLLEALQSLGFRSGFGRLTKATFPCVAFLKQEPRRPAIVLRGDGAPAAQGFGFGWPGMQVASEIHRGTRSILEYVLSPVQGAFHDAGRER